MRFAHIPKSSRLAGGWPRELLLTGIALTVGFVLMPFLIFFAGSALLGRYEGASVGRLKHALWVRGLASADARMTVDPPDPETAAAIAAEVAALIA